jgi:hypothetical protein
MLKINLKNKKYIILIHLWIKNILKSNSNTFLNTLFAIIINIIIVIKPDLKWLKI